MTQGDSTFISFVVGYLAGIAILFLLLFAGGAFDSDLPSCAEGAPEDVVVYRLEVPGDWNACAPADDLVGVD